MDDASWPGQAQPGGMVSGSSGGKFKVIHLSEAEVALIGGRIGLTGTYLSLEAWLTNSLWLPIGTCATGLLAAMLLCREAVPPSRNPT